MKRMSAARVAEYLKRLAHEERCGASLLALIGLDLVAFFVAALLALTVPDALDAAANGANESALVFSVVPHGGSAPEVLTPITAPPR